ncbi:hypothetical protein GCM10009630_63740 [Kribbella jejuensis]
MEPGRKPYRDRVRRQVLERVEGVQDDDQILGPVPVPPYQLISKVPGARDHLAPQLPQSSHLSMVTEPQGDPLWPSAWHRAE